MVDYLEDLEFLSWEEQEKFTRITIWVGIKQGTCLKVFIDRKQHIACTALKNHKGQCWYKSYTDIIYHGWPDTDKVDGVLRPF